MELEGVGGVVVFASFCCRKSWTEQKDKQEELETIAGALKLCGYPKWTIETARKQIETNKSTTKTAQKKKRKTKVM